jgi:hypothetical protein
LTVCLGGLQASDQDLAKALERIYNLLQGQYTLAYYPKRVDTTRKIEVKVTRNGVNIAARHSVGPQAAAEAVRFSAVSCEVSALDHPYPWEAHAARDSAHPSRYVRYHDDFSDPTSGWPSRRFDWSTHSSWHYVRGGYELYRWGMPAKTPSELPDAPIATGADTIIAAYGPWWSTFRATAVLEGEVSHRNSGFGLMVDVNEGGYYALVLNQGAKNKQPSFEFVKGTWNGTRSALLPWTSLPETESSSKQHKLSIESYRGRMELTIDDRRVGAVADASFHDGLVGFGVIGDGRTTVHDLLVTAPE